MLIGLSVSRCIADVMNNTVNVEDILVIIGRTHFNLDTLDELIFGYQISRGPWHNFNQDDLKELITFLYKLGKIHQPRQFGSHPVPASEGKHWLRVVHQFQDLPAGAQKAWDQYVLLASFGRKGNFDHT